MSHSPPRISTADTALLVIDVQEKLLPLIRGVPRLIENLAFLLDVAREVGVPILATEQYPKGLGPTHSSVAERLPANLPAKVVFSCGGVPEVIAGLAGRPTVLLAGIEAHVCVMHTALDLLAGGRRVFVAADAVSSRDDFDRDIALRRMEQAGVVLTTVEAAAFEWMGGSAAPAFKTVSRLVQERSRRLREMSGAEVQR
jgi:nicotinamidase-related amidase